MGKFRDGARVTGEAVTLILATIDRVKNLLEQLEQNQTEPAGNDRDLIAELERVAAATTPTQAAPQPNENVIDELERAFGETPGPRYQSGAVAPPAQDAQAGAADTGHVASRDEEHSDSKIANQSIRVHVDTLEHLMTMVSELVLTRNQLLDIGRRHEESEFKPRCSACRTSPRSCRKAS